MPLTSPAYPIGPYRFFNREFPIITYRTEHRLQDIELKVAWSGPAELTLFFHALAPLAELPVLENVSGTHIIADLTLDLGEVVHDYLA